MNLTPTILLAASLGIFISIALPILRAHLPKPEQKNLTNTKPWDFFKPWIITAIFSLLSALLILSNFGAEVTFEEALVAGYAWDSTLQKMRGPIEFKQN